MFVFLYLRPGTRRAIRLGMKEVIEFPAKKRIDDSNANKPRKLVSIAESAKFKRTRLAAPIQSTMRFRLGIDEWPFSVA